MSDKTTDFKSIIGPLITGYIKEMRAVGYKYIKGASLLKQFDTLATKEHLHEKNFQRSLYFPGPVKDQMRRVAPESEGYQQCGDLQSIWCA